MYKYEVLMNMHTGFKYLLATKLSGRVCNAPSSLIDRLPSALTQLLTEETESEKIAIGGESESL